MMNRHEAVAPVVAVDESELDVVDTTFLFSPEHGVTISGWTFTAPAGATKDAIREALTIRKMDCWHEHDCCGCTCARGVLVLERESSGDTWFAVLETSQNV